jgi:hypothetical protein
MTFGQPSGPPASSAQMRELLQLLQNIGHATFKEARGPLRLTQRQAGGRFTRDEATALIDQLQGSEHEGQASAEEPFLPMQSAEETILRRMPAEQLAVELRRRNWIVIEPLLD